MSIAVTYTVIVVAFLAVFALCVEISVRKRRTEQPNRPVSNGRRFDPASPTPPSRLARVKSQRCESTFSR